MYIAGIHLSNNRLTEGIVTSCLFVGVATMFYTNHSALKSAGEKGGAVKSLPTTFLGKIITPVHIAAMVLPPVAYLIAIPLNGCVQPGFIARLALPLGGLSEATVNTLRIAGCAGLLVALMTFTRCSKALGQSFHYIGVREESKIVSFGPFSVVRHPLYSSVLAQQLALSLMLWSYIPLAAFAVCAASYVAKIPIEEGLIEADPDIGPEYVEYKKKVTYRLIPRIW